MPYPERTPGIPGPLLKSMRGALGQSRPFLNPLLLLAVFDQEKLKAYRGRIPEGFDIDSRVNLTISHLHGRYHVAEDGSYENALAILLRAAAAEEEDALQQQLERLADTWEWYLKRPVEKEDAVAGERNPNQVAMLHMADAQKMLQNARSVAQLSAPRIRNGRLLDQGTGTAWLIAPTLAVTAWHVIEARSREDGDIAWSDIEQQYLNAELKFDFLNAGEGIKYGVAGLEFPRDSNPSLDFAVLRLEDRPQFPLKRWGCLKLDLDAPLTVQTMLYVIQHPLGRPQQGAADLFVRNVEDRPGTILYKTPTEPGTSGAPVFIRDTWRVVALHRGENRRHKLREGILVTRMLAEMRDKAPGLYEEILSTQEYG